MSVINKMLKDLEQRDQEQGEEFDPSNAVYQPVQKSKLPIVLAAMLMVILALGAVIAWLWMLYSKESKVSTPAEAVTQTVASSGSVSNSSSASGNASTSMKRPEAKPQVLNSSPVLQMPETSMATQVAANEKSAAASEESVTELEVGSMDEINDFAVIENEPQTSFEAAQPEQVKNESEVEAPAFKIEKSSSKLTREERVEKLMTKAQESFDKGYTSDAVAQLEEVLAASDDHVAARNLLAVAWYGRGELQQAVNILNDGLSRYPTIEEWRLTAAKIYFKENQLSGAFSYLDADLPSASSEYQSMKGSLARQLKRFDKAEEAYANLTRIEPDKANWWLGYAIALDSQSKSLLAKDSYMKAVERSGLSPASVQFAQQRIAQLQE